MIDNWRAKLTRHGIMVKMMLRSILMLSFTLVAVEYVSYKLSSEQIIKMTHDQQTAITSIYSERTEKTIKGIESDIKDLSAAPSLRDYHRNITYNLSEEATENLKTSIEVFKRLYEQMPGYLFLEFFRADGQELIHLQRGKTDYQGGGHAAHKRTSVSAAEDVAYEGIADVEEPKSQALVFSSPVHDTDKKLIGMVRVGYNLNSLLEKLKQERIFETGYLALFDANGEIIFYPHRSAHEAIATIHPNAADLLKKMKELKKGSVQAQLEDPYSVGFTSLTARDWIVAAFVPENEMFAVLNKIKRVVLVVVGANVVIEILLLAFFLQVLILKPLRQLLDVTKRIQNGDLTARIQVHTDDEIADIARSFNEMTNSLEANFHRVEELNLKLKNTANLAENANQAKSVFLANISHELRTPMHGILSFARFGQQKIETATKDKLKSYFDEIYDSGSRLMGLLNDLLDLSKLESGKTAYTMCDENIISVARSVASEMNAFAEEKGIHLEIESSEQEIVGKLDREKIMQVMRNLISNAIKFSEKGTVVQAVFSQTPEMIKCQIINHGVGIPESELETVFDKFIQSSKTKTGAGGTGLGLAICREIIEQHGGRIWAENHPNKETRFTFELPRYPHSWPPR